MTFERQSCRKFEFDKRNLFFQTSRGRFSFAIAGADECGKRDLCHWSKFIVLSMRGGYLATESSRILHVVWAHLTKAESLQRNARGAGHSGLKLQSANISWGMRFEECRPSKVVDSGWIKVSSVQTDPTLLHYASVLTSVKLSIAFITCG